MTELVDEEYEVTDDEAEAPKPAQAAAHTPILKQAPESNGVVKPKAKQASIMGFFAKKTT